MQVSAHEGLERTLLSLRDTELRAAFFLHRLHEQAPELSAVELNGLCEANNRLEAPAREALMAVCLALAALGDSEQVAEMRKAAYATGLVSLERLLRRSAADSMPEHVQSERRIPDYGTGRELTVGERRSLARRPSRRHIQLLLRDPHPLVIRELLKNPKLTEDDVVRLATHRPANRVALETLARSARWLRRTRVRLSVILNPGTPQAIAVPLLSVCTRTELVSVRNATDLSALIRSLAHEFLALRPPLKQAASAIGTS